MHSDCNVACLLRIATEGLKLSRATFDKILDDLKKE